MGSGKLDLFGYLRGDRDSGSAGGGVDLEARIKKDLSLFGTGRIGHDWGPMSSGLSYEALAGLRWRW